MKLSSYEKAAQRELDKWQRDDGSIVSVMINWAMQPVDWAMDKIVTPDGEEQADSLVSQFLSLLNNASEWTHDPNDLVKKAQEIGIEVESLTDLRDHSLEELDALSKSLFSQNAILAAVEGGGTGLGGIALIAADIPLLFTINLRLIQQIGAAYGFDLSGEEFQPLVLSIFNVAASRGRTAKADALREISVAGAALANELEYKGKVRSSFSEQSRHLPREIIKNILGRKLAQVIPIAGAAVGAGVNYWFTMETAEASYMLFRALYIERKERL